MYRHISAIFALFLPLTAVWAQGEKKAKAPEYQFTTIKEAPITSIKNQYRSGTCWAFSTISFLESEAIRLNKIKDTTKYPDFSEMFIVSHSYQDRADKYVRMDGHLTFAPGSECDDVLHVMNDYGLVPQEVQNGLNYGTDKPVHGELDAAAKAYVEAIVKNPNKTLSTAWKQGFKGIMDAYLGECPKQFEYKGKKYTPASYRDSYKLKKDNYITLTSFNHRPFYKPFALEVCDNWRWDLMYNLPLDEFMEVLYYAIENGYTVAWGSDVSESGFTRNGMGRLPMDKSMATAGSDQERWIGKSTENQELPEDYEEQTVTQESRQIGYDNKKTTDDHGMHIFGLAKDQYGKNYFMVKNSWGKTGKYKGIWYVSDAFVRAKTMDFMVHKDAVPSAIKKKLGIK